MANASANEHHNYLFLYFALYLEPTLRAHRIQTVSSSSNKLSSVLIKRRSPDTNCRCGVYVIPCQECELMCIGQTGKYLEVRLNQHKDAVRLGHANNGVFKHVRDPSHAIDWKAAKLVISHK